MAALLFFVLNLLASPFKSKSRLEAENAALRHQLIVLRRKMSGRVGLSNSDRWFFVQLYRSFPSVLQVLTIIQPETALSPAFLAELRKGSKLVIEFKNLAEKTIKLPLSLGGFDEAYTKAQNA